MQLKPHLFAPLSLEGVELKNRFVMAPLTRNRAGEGNVPHALNTLYYTQRASAGLIITEATQVSEQGVGYPKTPGIHSQEQVAGWRKVTESVHAKGGKIFLQLWHVGRISHQSLQPDGALPVAPSAIKPAGNAVTMTGPQPFPTPRALELEEIAGLIEQFRSAGENALAAGFDGVEVHAANGYLIDQFIRDGVNKRSDRYGGSPENRARLLLEIVKELVTVWGAGRVGVRLSPMGAFNDMSDSDPAVVYGYILSALNSFPLAYVHLVEPGPEDLKGRQNPVPLAFFREKYHGRLMANGGYDKERAEQVIGSGLCDLVSFGKLFIANPDLVDRFNRNAGLNQPDFSTFYGGGEKGYTDYPFLGGAASSDGAGGSAA